MAGPSQPPYQYTQAPRSLSPTGVPGAEMDFIREQDLNYENECEAQNFLHTGKSRFEKSSASGNLEFYHDPDANFIFEENKSLHWWKPIIWMAILLLLGVVVGLGHHFAYQNLDQQPQYIISQTWVHNLGSAAAFLVKTSFTLTVMLALQEVLWFSFRKKAIKISLLDKLFTLSSNPFSFVPSAFINAPVATCLAGFAWFIPISAILSPGSLVVGPMIHTFIDSNCSVPTFAAASSNISFYQMVPDSDPPAIQGSNPGIQKLANQIFAQGTILDPGSPCGSNCSFQLSFFGPALQCTQTTNPEYMHESADGSNFYYAEDLTRFGEDENSFMGMDFTYCNHTKENYSWIYVDMLCSPYNTTYDISVNYTNGLPDFYTNLTYNTPLLNLNSTQSTYPENFPWSSNSATLVREVYDNHLNGTWTQAPNRYFSSHDTMIANTVLVGDTVDANNGTSSSLWIVNRDLITGIPELLTNLTISTLAISPLSTTTNCSASVATLVYLYNPRLLLVPYSIAFLLSFIAFIAGVCVLKITHMRTGGAFSQILVTTRNPFLDDITKDHSLSSADSDVMKNYKLRLGKLKRRHGGESGFRDGNNGERAGHVAFGLAEQVDGLH